MTLTCGNCDGVIHFEYEPPDHSVGIWGGYTLIPFADLAEPADDDCRCNHGPQQVERLERDAAEYAIELSAGEP